MRRRWAGGESAVPLVSRSVSGEAVAAVPRTALAIFSDASRAMLPATVCTWSLAAERIVPCPPASVRAIELVRVETESTIVAADRLAASTGGAGTETGGWFGAEATARPTVEATVAPAESGAFATSGASTGCASALAAGASASSTGAVLATVVANCSTGAVLLVVAGEVGSEPAATSALAAGATSSKAKATVALTTMKRANRRRTIGLLPVG